MSNGVFAGFEYITPFYISKLITGGSKNFFQPFFLENLCQPSCHLERSRGVVRQPAASGLLRGCGCVQQTSCKTTSAHPRNEIKNAIQRKGTRIKSDFWQETHSAAFTNIYDVNETAVQANDKVVDSGGEQVKESSRNNAEKRICRR
jgi:hypothetical protein